MIRLCLATPKFFASGRPRQVVESEAELAIAWLSSRFPASLVRLKLVRRPRSLAPTLVALPSMSLAPALHSLRSSTPAVLFCNDTGGSTPSR
jgi:hypothetical protein